jgi:hypothetical protein
MTDLPRPTRAGLDQGQMVTPQPGVLGQVSDLPEIKVGVPIRGPRPASGILWGRGGGMDTEKHRGFPLDSRRPCNSPRQQSPLYVRPVPTKTLQRLLQ